MALFARIPKDIIKEVYSHTAFYIGIVPVYILLEDEVDYEKPTAAPMWMCERNGIPKGSILLVSVLWRLFTIFHKMIPPVYITGRL